VSQGNGPEFALRLIAAKNLECVWLASGPKTISWPARICAHKVEKHIWQLP